MPVATLQEITLSQFQVHHVYVGGKSVGRNASILCLEDAEFESRPGPGYPEFSRDFGDSIQRTAKTVPGNREVPRQPMYCYFPHSLIVLPSGTTYCDLPRQPSNE